MDRVVASAALALLLLLLAPRAGAGPSAVTSAERSAESDRKKSKPKTWALLVAGSSGYWNYRHQVSDEAGALLKADVCHAYQLLRRGGLKEENIVVMMYDDIAYNPSNPRPGVIINKPGGKDVYAGVPKDYTGTEVNVKNMFAVLLGNKSAVEGGSGKVINSKPHDRIFVYYADHGGPGVLCMPKDDEYVYAKDFIEVLKKKHALKSYKEMVIYVEACESGSIFEGLLPKNLNIYVTTASSATESSWATYCPRSDEPPPPGYDTCLGDLYSVAWMEDSDSHNLRKETVGKQYQNVKLRTSNMKNATYGSHVMEYGDKSIKAEKLYQYQGFNPGNDNATENEPQWRRQSVVNQRDADLLFLWMRYEKADAGSEEKAELYKEITETILHRKHLDNNIESIGKLIFGSENGPSILTAVRPSGQALVDDWDCLKSMVQVFESHCGPLTQYGVKHMRAFANLCNKGVSREAMERASAVACESYSLANHAVPAHH